MNYKIELYRGPEYHFAGTIPFLPIIRESVERLMRRQLQQPLIQIVIVQVPDDSFVQGLPIVENLIPDFGYAQIKVFERERIVYQHHHPLSDLVNQTLQARLREKYPDEQLWGFRVDIPGMPGLSAYIATPQVHGSVAVQPYAPGQKPAFSIRRIAEDEPPVATLANFGIQEQGEQPDALVKVLVPAALQLDLCYTRRWSYEVEEGGFLVGKVYQDGDHEGCYLLEITQALAAQQTGASLLHFTFTGDSFAAVKRTLRQNHPHERMVGWYHTHLFPATDDFGLSGVDYRLHFSTFTFPWQLAGLINLDNETQRTLRFYIRQNNEMIQCPMWTINQEYQSG